MKSRSRSMIVMEKVYRDLGQSGRADAAKTKRSQLTSSTESFGSQYFEHLRQNDAAKSLTRVAGVNSDRVGLQINLLLPAALGLIVLPLAIRSTLRTHRTGWVAALVLALVLVAQPVRAQTAPTQEPQGTQTAQTTRPATTIIQQPEFYPYRFSLDINRILQNRSSFDQKHGQYLATDMQNRIRLEQGLYDLGMKHGVYDSLIGNKIKSPKHQKLERLLLLMTRSTPYHPEKYFGTYQHESGHVFRTLDVGAKVLSMNVTYGQGGRVYSNFAGLRPQALEDAYLLVTNGGREAEAVGQRNMRSVWLDNDRFYYEDYPGYFADRFTHVMDSYFSLSQPDMANAVRSMNEIYPNQQMGRGARMVMGAWELADPNTLFGNLGFIYKRDRYLKPFRIKGIGVGLDSVMTPWGGELMAEAQKGPWRIGLGFDPFAAPRSARFSFDRKNVLTFGGKAVDLSGEIWRQPELFNAPERRQKVGGRIGADLNMPLNERYSLTGGVEMKTPGFSLGRTVKGGTKVEFGLIYSFPVKQRARPVLR